MLLKKCSVFPVKFNFESIENPQLLFEKSAKSIRSVAWTQQDADNVKWQK